MKQTLTFEEWVAYTFELAECNLGNSTYPGTASEACQHCITFFNKPQDVLISIPRPIAIKSLWRLPSIDGYGGLLSYPNIPLEQRAKMTYAQISLFQGAFWTDDYEGACFMWWENLRGAEWDEQDSPPIRSDRVICDCLIQVIQRILTFDSEVCILSALHGINEIGPLWKEGDAKDIARRYLQSGKAPTQRVRDYAMDVIEGRAP